MKKLLLLLTAITLPTLTLAQFGDEPFQDLPPLEVPYVTYSGINISQDNVDAAQTGARPGDLIRFEILVDSESDITDYTPRADLSRMAQGLSITDSGIGEVQGQEIVFPAIQNASAPFSEKFVFFGRVNQECGGIPSLDTQALDGNVLSIGLNNCDHTGGEGACNGPNGCGKDLSNTGPNTFAAVAAIILTIFAFFLLLRRKQA